MENKKETENQLIFSGIGLGIIAAYLVTQNPQFELWTAIGVIAASVIASLVVRFLSKTVFLYYLSMLCLVISGLGSMFFPIGLSIYFMLYSIVLCILTFIFLAIDYLTGEN